MAAQLEPVILHLFSFELDCRITHGGCLYGINKTRVGILIARFLFDITCKASDVGFIRTEGINTMSKIQPEIGRDLDPIRFI